MQNKHAQARPSRPSRLFQDKKGLFILDGEVIRRVKSNLKLPDAQLELIKRQEGKGEEEEEEEKDITGLYEDEIDKIMFRSSKTYAGTIASDEINKIKVKKKTPTSFIINTEPRSEDGQHWIAVYIDPVKAKSVEVFDSFAEEPQPETEFGQRLMYDLDKKIKALKLPYMLKFKSNMIPQQNTDTETCGYHCIRFILEREMGRSFKDVTGYSYLPPMNEIGERKAEMIHDNIIKWGYL